MCRTNERAPQKTSLQSPTTEIITLQVVAASPAMFIPSLTLLNWYNSMVCPEVGFLSHQKYCANNPYYIFVCVMRKKLSATQNLPAPLAFTFLIQINKCKHCKAS